MIVWGGRGVTGLFNNGGRYNPTTGAWTAVTTNGAPVARESHTAVWTGSEMIVFGGVGSQGQYFADGARYNPSLDSWLPLPSLGAPSPRGYQKAVWTGNEMVLWGGYFLDVINGEVFLGDGGRYSPTANTWTTISSNAAIYPRWSHSMVWTGSKAIIWGGRVDDGFYDPYNDDSGATFIPTPTTWQSTSTNNTPGYRANHTAVWTGSDMLVWGGVANTVTWYQDGGRYNLSSNTWTALSTSGAPSVRESHTAVWSGSEMIVWGGRAGSSYRNTGGRYDSAGNSWASVSTSGAPTSRENHTAIWTGREMIVWGGDAGLGIFFNSMGRYQPVADVWDVPPVCSLSSPTNGAAFSGISSLLLSAAAGDADGTVAHVDFFADGALLGTRLTPTNSAYTFLWAGPASGAHALTAVAVDNLGIATTSAPVNVTITAALPPIVSLSSPSSNAIFPEFTSINLTAAASDPDGMVTQVVFYADSTLIGSDAISPYSFVWSNVPPGVYSLTSRAYDNSGMISTSAPVDIIINALPLVGLTNPAASAKVLFNAPVQVGATASDTDGSVTQVAFFANGSPLGTTTNSPYSATWNNSSLGFFTLTAVATDNRGMSRTSAPVTVESVLKPTLAVATSPGSLQISLTGGQTNRSYRVDYSPDLASWFPLATNIASNGTMTIVDSPPTNVFRRFYRAVP
ncbi:MAG TPA: Ig-like domain-containing protein [Verrucomicrobiae bacterium]